MSDPLRTAGRYQVSHALTGPYLPPPGRVPGWPFQEMGRWRADAAGDADDWVRGFTEWRAEHLIRIGFDDALYREPALAWAQRNFVHALAMIEDRYLYDPEAGRYTVDRYLDDLDARLGGIDSVLLWYVYPNIGIDDRGQFDLIHDLPGGLGALKDAVDDFHRRGVRVFLPTMPWDNGTRPDPRPDWVRLAELVAAVGADGINGDTYSGVPRAFYDACAARGRPVVLQPESTAQAGDHILGWNLQSWTKRVPDEPVPAVIKLKWLEPRHIVNIENRWSRDRIGDLQHAFFNGVGYVAWENVFGFWNGFTARDAAALRRVAAIQRFAGDLLASPAWRPYAPTLQFGVFASRWPGGSRILWTVINRNPYAVDGEQLAIDDADEHDFHDLWSGRPLDVRREDGRAILSFALEPRGFGAVLAVPTGTTDGALTDLLTAMREQAETPLAALSPEWRPALQTIVPAPRAAAPREPGDMVAIPAAAFDFRVHGIVIEGFAAEGVDVQYPWEPSPRRHHRHRLPIDAFRIDRFPVTNAAFARFLAASGWRPADPHNFLRHWVDGAPPPGWDRKPVTWVGLEDARAYAAWAGKRLPREWEWQYAAQGRDGCRYPWGDDWREDAVPAPALGRAMPAPADVDAHPAGASPFGVMDLVGNVWEWTDEYRDEHLRAAVLRGGSRYQPQASHWYFPQGYALDEHGKYLLMAPAKDRSAGIGFRCAADG